VISINSFLALFKPPPRMIAGMIDERTYARIAGRMAQLDSWLEQEAPYAQFDQRHLDPHTPEQAYWHLGYHRALSDVLSLVRETGGSAGTANPSPTADSDE
jgi:hypothetical protein